MPKPHFIVPVCPPCGGKGHLKTCLRGYEGITVVGMSDLIKAREESDPAFARFSRALRASGNFHPCDIIMDLFNDFMSSWDGLHLLFEGIPRTKRQGVELVRSPNLKRFGVRKVIDISVPRHILDQRNAERLLKEKREDDLLHDYRLQLFESHRMDVLQPFSTDDNDWVIRCFNGEDYNASELLARDLATLLKLRPKEEEAVA